MENSNHMGNFMFELSEGREITTVEDFLQLMAQDPQKYSFGWIYYTYPASMPKTYMGRKNPNPLYARVFKHKPYKFRWEETYRDAMLRKDPNFVFKGSRAKYTQAEGLRFMQNGPNGLYFPIVPQEDNPFHTIYTVDWKPVSYQEVAPYIDKPSGYNPPTIKCLEHRIAGIAAGGALLKNPAFEFEYRGEGPQAERFR